MEKERCLPKNGTQTMLAKKKYIWIDCAERQEGKICSFLNIHIQLIILCSRYWFAPFGKSLGIKNTRPKKAPINPTLESAYQASPKIKHKQV